MSSRSFRDSKLFNVSSTWSFVQKQKSVREWIIIACSFRCRNPKSSYQYTPNKHLSDSLVNNIENFKNKFDSLPYSPIITLPHYRFIITYQELSQNDFVPRIQFCYWTWWMRRRDPSFFSFVLFSDEANFNNRYEINRHNCLYWSRGNHRWYRTIPFQYRWSFNAWCGIVNGYIIGHHFYGGILTGAVYPNFIQNEFPAFLENVDLAIRACMWFKHDGAPRHNANHVRDSLQAMFPGYRFSSCIGRHGLVGCPTRSPNLTPLDFFLRDYVKNEIFQV